MQKLLFNSFLNFTHEFIKVKTMAKICPCHNANPDENNLWICLYLALIGRDNNNRMLRQTFFTSKYYAQIENPSSPIPIHKT